MDSEEDQITGQDEEGKKNDGKLWAGAEMFTKDLVLTEVEVKKPWQKPYKRAAVDLNTIKKISEWACKHWACANALAKKCPSPEEWRSCMETEMQVVDILHPLTNIIIEYCMPVWITFRFPNKVELDSISDPYQMVETRVLVDGVDLALALATGVSLEPPSFAFEEGGWSVTKDVPVGVPKSIQSSMRYVRHFLSLPVHNSFGSLPSNFWIGIRSTFPKLLDQNSEVMDFVQDWLGLLGCEDAGERREKIAEICYSW